MLVKSRDVAESEARDSLAWSSRSQIAFVLGAMPALLFLFVIAPYLLTHYVVNRHDRFNYIPPPLGGDRALEGHWTDAPLVPARLVKIEGALGGFGWIAPNEDLAAKVFPTAVGSVGQVFVSVGEAVAKDAPLFSIQVREPSVSSDAQTRSSEVVVASPIAGTIAQIAVAAGEAVKTRNAQTTPAALVGDLSSVWLATEVEPAVARALRPNEMVEVRPIALADRSFSGRVLRVSPAESETMRASVRILVENADGALKLGMFAAFSVQDEANEALMIPESAVLFENDGARVFVKEREGGAPGAAAKLVARTIRVGRVEGGWVEAIEGLKPGEEVEATDAAFIDRAAKGY